MTFLCRVTGKEIKAKCPVKTCMYNSVVNKTGCIQEEVIDDASLVEHRDIPIKFVNRERRDAAHRINKVFLLERYEKWLLNNNRLLDVEIFDVHKISPTLNYPGSRWTSSLLTAAVQPENYKEFCKDKGVKLNVSIAELLAISDSNMKMLRRKGKKLAT